jgi:hypothetical protein
LRASGTPFARNSVRRLCLEEQDKVLRSYFAQKGGARSQGGDRVHAKGREHVQGTCMRHQGAREARGPGLNDHIAIKGGAWNLGFAPAFSWVC